MTSIVIQPEPQELKLPRPRSRTYPGAETTSTLAPERTLALKLLLLSLQLNPGAEQCSESFAEP